MRFRSFAHGAAAFLWFAVGAALGAPLPQLAVDLTAIAPGTCRDVEWELPHSYVQVSICHLAHTAPATRAPAMIDEEQLRDEALAWRERKADEGFAQGVFTMQRHLDALAHRSFDAHWRVLVNEGTLGCQPARAVSAGQMTFSDVCTGHRYDAEGRPLGEGYPALAIPPYAIESGTLTIGQLPTSLAAVPLPARDADAPGAPLTDRLVRAARWGDVELATRLVANGADVNAIATGGNTALLTAIQMRQTGMVTWLLTNGADVHAIYPSGLGPLELAEIVRAPAIAAMLREAGATPTAERAP